MGPGGGAPVSLVTIGYILEVAFGIGLLIFVHELGHFLIARKVGVRVEVFSLGFGPRLFGVRRGPTDYRVSLVPFGGYVKMAGETPSMQGTGRPDEFPSKTVGERALIASGGVLMNLVAAFVLFILAFLFGVKFVLPEVGVILPGAEAYRIGLREGDRIVSVNGRPVSSFRQVGLAIAYSSDDETVEIVVERAGEEGAKRIPIEFQPEFKEALGHPQLGGLSPRLSSLAVKVDPDSAAFTAIRASDRTRFPLRRGDLITHVAGEPIPLGDGVALQKAFFDRPGEEVVVKFLRSAEVVTNLTRDDEGGIRPEIEYRGGKEEEVLMRLLRLRHHSIGAYPEDPPVVAGEISEGAPAYGILQKGDQILKIEGEDSRTRSLYEAVRYGGGRPVEMVISRDGEEMEVSVTPRFYGGAFYMVGVDNHSDPVIGRVDPESPAERAGLRVGDRILAIDGVELVDTTRYRRERWRLVVGSLSYKRTKPAKLKIQRGDNTRTVEVMPEPDSELAYGSSKIGLGPPLFNLRSANLLEATRLGVRGTVDWIGRVFLTIRSLVSGRVTPKNLGGPVMIADASYQFATQGFGTILYFLGIISINLAILNILPIPVLDGGLLFFLAIEKIKGSPVKEKHLIIANYMGLALLLSLMVYVTYNDIVRLLQR